MLAAGVAVAIGLGTVPARADHARALSRPNDATVRFRLLPPYLDPRFVDEPVPPPDKSYLIPLGEVLVFDFGLWAADYALGKPYSKISWSSIEHQFEKGWILDTDEFWANDLLHPLHGAMTYNAARSTGLGFYESFGYSFLGSFLWEQFAETLPPSINDQVYSPFGGTLVGETLFRLSRLILDSGGYAPSSLRELFALVVSPVGGANRLMFGDRFRGELLLPRSWMGEFHVGGMLHGSSWTGEPGTAPGDAGPWVSLGADLVYGVPGTPDLSLSHPFDHFTLFTSVTFANDRGIYVPSAKLMIRGLLLGETISPGASLSGLWGLFASYDFIDPSVFRIACFGAGPGVSMMKRWGSFELHGSAVGQLLPWSEGGSTAPPPYKDYRYGPGADLILELRAHVGDRVIARLEAREYWISGAYERGKWEDVSFAKAQLTVRIFGANAVSGALEWGHRQARYPFQQDFWQRTSVASLYYTILQGW